MLLRSSGPRNRNRFIAAGGGGGGSPGEWAGNLPGGLSLHWDQDFEGSISDATGGDLTFINGVGMPGWTGNWEKAALAGYTLDGHSNAAQCSFSAGSTGDGSGVGKIESSFLGWDEIYVCNYLWLPENYSTHSNEEKDLYPQFTDGSETTLCEIGGFYLTGSQTPDGPELTLGCAQMESPSGRFYQSAPYIQKGQVHLIERYVRCNTSAAANGLVRIWVDGTLVMDEAVQLTASGPVTMNYWFFETQRGGGTSSHQVPLGGQVRQYPRIAVYGA